MANKSAVVVGGGFAGLTAGYWLKQAGWSVTLLESAACVGGRVATVHKQSYVLDTGATQISTGYTEYMELAKAVGLSNEIVDSSPYIAILKNGRQYVIDGSSMFSGPLSPLLSIGGKFAMLKTIGDYLKLKPRIDVRDVSRSCSVDIETAEAYSLRRLNREVYDALVDPLIRAYVINRGNDVSCLEWFSGLGNLAGQQMTSLNGGNKRMPEALAKNLDVRLNTAVSRVIKTDIGVEVNYRDGSGNSQMLAADACVLATRLPEALAIYPPGVEIAGKLATDLRYNRGLVVQVGFCKRTYSKAIGVMMPAIEKPEITLVWLEHNKNIDRVPDGHSLFSVYFDEAVCDQYFHRSDDELIRFAAQYMEQLFPEIAGTLDMSHVTRWPMAIPNPTTGIYTQVAAMKQRINPADRIQFAGDYFTCTGQNSAIYWGKKAAENLIRHQ